MTTTPFQADWRWRQVRKLTEVSRALTYTTSLNDVLDLAVRSAAELLQAEKAVLMLTNDDGLLSVRASHGLDKATCERFREPLSETLISRLQGLLGDIEKENFLGVPLVVGGEVTGLLAVASRHALENLEEREWLLSALADQAAVALEKTRLDETAEFRERLIGIVSHDLRGPITAISIAVEAMLLKREFLDERTVKSAARIQKSVERAKRMIGDLLDSTQARLGGGIQVATTSVDLNAIVRQVVDELETAQPGRTIEVTQHSDGRGDWDPERLAQVVGNLLANALHYSPPQTTVHISTDDWNGQVVLTVHNQGTPIPPERLPQLFEPFQRARAEITGATRSVGLGLYIVKQIVEAHRGSVSIESSKEKGTTVRVHLPRSQSPATN